MSQVQIRNAQNEALVGINFTVSRSINPDDTYIEDFFTDFAGNSSWPHFGVPWKDSWLHVNYYNRNEKYEYRRISGNTEHDIQIFLEREPLKKLAVDGLYFNVDHLCGNSDFTLYKKFLDGDSQLSGIVKQRYSCGSKYVRTFGTGSAQSFGVEWKPQDYGNRYYDNIIPMAHLLESYGLYWYFNVFADAQLVMPSLQQQLDHYNWVVDELSKCNNIFMELVNEQGQHSNSVERDKFKKPDSFIACSGSFGGRVPPQEPHWDFIDYHTRRDYPGFVMECNTADYNDNGKTRVSIGKPIGTGEGVKFGSDADTNERTAFEMGQSGKGSSPFNCFHTKAGTRSELWDSNIENLARKFFK